MLNLKSTRRTFVSSLGFMAGALTGAMSSARNLFATPAPPAAKAPRITGFGSTGNVYEELGVTTVINGQSAGTYDHYFGLFLSPVDVLWSFLKVMLFSVVVILIHCYYGYRASGGPAGVGVAVGRAVRTAIVMINIIDFFMSLAIWGATTTVRVTG